MLGEALDLSVPWWQSSTKQGVSPKNQDSVLFVQVSRVWSFQALLQGQQQSCPEGSRTPFLQREVPLQTESIKTHFLSSRAITLGFTINLLFVVFPRL